ncbi:MAG: type III-B CRISPR-associated protein Cas10/Cmr2 [Symploca sp. SIO1B1]|nr:type III-B CRISPR-associated protein Cas10/Cmr2 [Symploca sp. SIO1B1]
MTDSTNSMTIAIAWCLAWGEGTQPQFDLTVLQQMRQALSEGKEVPEEVRAIVGSVQQLETLDFPQSLDELKQLTQKYSTLWKAKIGLVFGGATKIKQYVFEAAKLPDIRGASGLLDRINLIDLPAFFKCEESPQDFPECQQARNYCQNVRWQLQNKDTNLEQLWPGLIPELVIYSTGGKILAFCPTAFVTELTNLIEKRYTEETLTANSCAVGDSFRLLETRLGLLNNPIEQTKWLDWYLENKTRQNHPIVEAYFGRRGEGKNWEDLFKKRKNFNELAGKLAALFNQRRNGNNLPGMERSSRRYPPMFETHPYLVRDTVEYRTAVAPALGLPDEPWFSDAIARKRIVGQRTKREDSSGQGWYKAAQFGWQSGQGKKLWQPGKVLSWVFKFEQFLKKSDYQQEYYQGVSRRQVKEARSLTEIGNASNGFVGYIYADGNNMGGYIQNELNTPEDYRKLSRDIFTATEESVYHALGQHLHPHKLKDLTGENQHRNGAIIHPFEILTIGGDDVILIVPADKALEIAKNIGDKFEQILLEKEDYRIKDKELIAHSRECHRYQGKIPLLPSQGKLSMSVGVLLASANTPIYYAENLTNQLLKSAKKKAKQLKQWYGYHGGTVDFLTMKSVTMISSNIESFRQEALTQQLPKQQKLKLYGAPYTLHELGGLLKTAEKLKESEFPRSQLYQIRSLLERGKHTAILNYRYFRVRLKADQQKLLKDYFEQAWCDAKTNKGNLAPWMSLLKEDETTTYETIWRELVDLYPFIPESKSQEDPQYSTAETQA